MTALLQAEGVTKTFGGYTALSDVSCDVEIGSIHAFIGPNGAGKTTLFNIVSGVLRPTAGRLVYQGRDYTGSRADQVLAMGVARNFQQVRLFHGLSVVENVMVGCHARMGGLLRDALNLVSPRPATEIAARVRALEMLQLVGMGDRVRGSPGELTLVDQRRLEIARALASAPRVLLLDEPAAGMNPADVSELAALVRRIRTLGITILLVEHHMRFVMAIADTITVLSAGRVIARGPPVAIQRDEERDRGLSGRRAMTLLAIDEVKVAYGNVVALDGVSLNVGEGEIVALIGANGAGKSTLMKAVMGLVRVAGGTIAFAGASLLDRRTYERAGFGIGYVAEGRGTLRQLTVRENLLMGAFSRGRDATIQADLHRVLQRFPPLAERLSLPAGLLSGGQQQMLVIARALMSRPRLLLLDEPSLGLAPLIAAEIFRTVATLTETGVAVLLVEQNAHAALRLAKRAYVIETGRIVISGTDLLHDPRVRKSYLGEVTLT